MRFGTGHRFGSARGGGGNGGGGGASGISPAVASPLLFLVGNNDLASSGGNVTSWADGGSIGNTYSPGTAPATTTLNSRPAVAFRTATSTALNSNGVAADYAALNNTTTGVTVYIALKPNTGTGTSAGYILDTLGGFVGSRKGLSIRLDNRAGLQRVLTYLGDGSGTALINTVPTGNNTFPQGTVGLYTLTFSQAAGYEMFVNNSSVASGALAGDGDATGTPNYALRIGRDNTNTGSLDADVPYIAAYAGVHNSTQRGLAYAQVQSLYGVP